MHAVDSRCVLMALALLAFPAMAAESAFSCTFSTDAPPGRYQPLTYSTAEWYGSTFWTGPDWTRVGRDWHHPGQSTASVRTFQAPQAGRVAVSGRVFKRHLSGDGILAAIRHNDRELWSVEIDGQDSQGKAHRLEVDLCVGDRLHFSVSKRTAIFCDTTGWNPEIAYVGGPCFRASEGFDLHRQGGGGWWYDMERSPAADPGLPAVYAFEGPDAALRVRALAPGLPLALKATNDVLPLVVVAGGRGQEGFVLAWEPSAADWTLRLACDAGGTISATVEGARDNAVFRRETAGTWVAALQALEAAWEDNLLPALRDRCEEILHSDPASLSLWAMIQEDWRRQDRIDDAVATYAAATRVQAKAARELFQHLCTRFGNDIARRLPADWSARLVSAPEAQDGTSSAACRAWLRVRRLKRQLALANPLLAFGPLLICKRVPPSWSHEVAQYYGWRQRPGGGLYVVEQPGYSMKTRDILHGQLPAGSVLEPRLSYDGTRILFAFVACSEDVPEPASLPVNEAGGNERYFHLYEINVDGSGLRQLTASRYDDMMADYLPDGDIVFCSTRRRGYSRCFGPEYSYRWHTYTLHRMDGDGGGIRALSLNDVSEWFPAVAHSGEILHARWDYIDRDAVTHQNLWSMRPDGTNPQAVWGNATPKPHCVFQAKPIPGSDRIVFIASAHHAITAGPVCLLDASCDPNSLDAITRLTPLPFPEVEGGLNEWYAAPWPLSEDLFLVAHSPYRLRFQGEHMRDPNPDNALGICLLDAWGNRELLYRDPDIGATTPVPLGPRPRPSSLPDTRTGMTTDDGEMLVSDIHQGLNDVPRGAVKALRIVQIFPKTTWLVNQPRMGVAGEENGRAILGTVPVEPDGSAYFRVPARTPVLFQALDKRGMALQTMRSLTYVQAGERTSCVGCHEHRMQAPPPSTVMAVRRPPSRIDPGDLGGRPFGFVDVVQPVLDHHCVRCHGDGKMEGKIDLTAKPHRGFTRSYWSLCGEPAAWKPLHYDPKLVEQCLVPRFAERNQIQTTVPGGVYGARGSRLIRQFTAAKPHHGVKLTDAELHRLAAWIDMNAIFYSLYESDGQAKQLRGETVAMPTIQ